MKERPILFSSPMVRALLDGSKTQTRRVVKWRGIEPGLNLQFSGLSAERSGSNWVLSSPTRTSHEYRSVPMSCPHGEPGDQLWVKETHWRDEEDGAIFYAADAKSFEVVQQNKIETGLPKYNWKPSIFMPRAASRISLEITGVRVERLQDISEDDALAEGSKPDQPETWWQGYKDAGEPLGLMHTQTMGEAPPDWMVEPHKMLPKPWLIRAAKWHYQLLWNQINGPGSWAANPWVWVIEFKRVAM